MVLPQCPPFCELGTDCYTSMSAAGSASRTPSWPQQQQMATCSSQTADVDQVYQFARTFDQYGCSGACLKCCYSLMLVILFCPLNNDTCNTASKTSLTTAAHMAWLAGTTAAMLKSRDRPLCGLTLPYASTAACRSKQWMRSAYRGCI